MQNRYSIVLLPVNKSKLIFHITFFILAVVAILLEEILVGSLFLITSLLGYITERKKIVHFSNESVVYPALIPRSIAWDEIANVILKDDIITIDLKNNKLFQHAINANESNINEKEFNEYCKSQLKPGDELRQEDNYTHMNNM